MNEEHTAGRIKKALKKAANCGRIKRSLFHFTETDERAGSERANQGDLLDNVPSRPDSFLRARLGSES